MTAPRTLLLTRPAPQSAAFAVALEAHLPGRFRVVASPLLAIVPVPADLSLDGLQGLVFTSANGVEQFAARTADRSLAAWCVGDMTAAAARAAGFVEVRSADGAVGALAEMVRAGHRPEGGAFLHVRGVHAAGDLVGLLALAGVPARAAALYDQEARLLSAEALELLRTGGVDAVALFSPRTARLFGAAAGDADLSRAVTVAMSPAADAAYAGPEPARRLVAQEPTRAGMMAVLAGLS